MQERTAHNWNTLAGIVCIGCATAEGVVVTDSESEISWQGFLLRRHNEKARADRRKRYIPWRQ